MVRRLQRDDVLTALDDTDANFAESVRKSIFTFELLPLRLPPRTVPTVTRAVEPETLMTALAGAQSDGDRAAAEFLLSNMPTRLADSLREEMAEAGDIRQSDAEKAMAGVVTRIRELADDGELSLIAPDEDVAEAA